MNEEREFVVWTGKGGAIDYLVALAKHMKEYVEDNLSPDEEQEMRERLERDLPTGSWKITDQGLLHINTINDEEQKDS